ncbi:MAG TPA: VOC family protein [Stellaceae bacterium]|nr:VOC family protein [Stellaceae bacterium]
MLDCPVLDHVVIDVRDRMDEAANRFAALGFTLTPRGHHTLGSMNHLMMFATDYLELLGFGDGGASRPELAPFPIGLNGLVFKANDADAVYAHAAAAGLPILPVQSFSRPVELNGQRSDARFRTTRLDPTKIPMGRVYFCEHRTPELVWRSEWQAHANGARAIARIVVATPDPSRSAALFSALFGTAATGGDNERYAMTAGAARVELVTPAAIAAEFGDGAPLAAGRAEYLAVVELKVTSLADTAARLREVADIRREPHRVVVPASAAFNSTIVFTI